MRHVITYFFLAGSLSLILFSSPLQAAEQPTFQVIINAANPHTELTTYDISKLFLKKMKRWQYSNDPVLPVDLLPDSSIREAFSLAIHDRKVAAIQAYWQKQIFSGRGVPPQEMTSEEEVIRYVSQHAEAIGYLSAETPVDTDSVSIVTILDE